MSKISTYSLADEPLQLSDRLIGTEAPRPIPSSTPLATKNFSLGELLQLFSSNFPAATLQAVLDAGNIATQNIDLTGRIDVTLIKPVNIEDMLGSEGTPLQILSKGVGGISWIDQPTIATPTLQQVVTQGRVYNEVGTFNQYNFEVFSGTDGITSSKTLFSRIRNIANTIVSTFSFSRSLFNVKVSNSASSYSEISLGGNGVASIISSSSNGTTLIGAIGRAAAGNVIIRPNSSLFSGTYDLGLSRIPLTGNTIADINVDYYVTTTGLPIVTDPTPPFSGNRNTYTVYCALGGAIIGGVTYGIGDLVYRTYNVSTLSWSSTNMNTSASQDLQSVTDIGNVTTNEIEVSNLGGDLYNTISSTQMLIVDDTNGFHHSFNINGISRLAPGGVTVIQYDDPTGTGVIKIPNVVDSTETFALLSDIPGSQDLQAVLDEGSTASITLSNGSVYAVSMPFDDVLNIYVSDSITSSDGNTQFVRSLQEGFIGNGATTNIGDITLVNQNNLSIPFENSGDYNTINSLYKADNAIAEAGSFAIQVPTPKIFPSFGEVILRYPYIETEGIYTLATTDDIPVYTIPSLKEVLAVEGRMPFLVTADYVLESTNKGETIVVDNSVSAVRLDLVGLDFAIGDEIEIYNSNCTNLGLNIVFSSGAIINYKGVAYDESAGNIPLPIYSKSWLKCIDVDIFELVIIEQNNLTGYVPYTGATSDVNLGEFGLLTGNIEFDNTPTNIPTAAGSMYYNDADGTVDLILKGGNVKLQIGQESVIRVVNKTATNINLLEANYQAVRVTGAQGQRLKVDLAQATNDLLSAETIGLVTETINNNQEGFITTSGLVRNINTTGSLQGETWADGDILYLSPTTAGMATKIKPDAPDHLLILGYVVHAHITQGSIFVKVDNGYELDELHNVKITSPQGGQALIYNQSLQIWENKIILDYTNNFLLMGG